jgi:hypothetical protein
LYFFNLYYTSINYYYSLFLLIYIFFIVAGRVWDALHLYIVNNLDWMKLWIEQCEQHEGRLSWEWVITLIKRAHRNEDRNLTQREIDLAYGLKDKQVSI